MSSSSSAFAILALRLAVVSAKDVILHIIRRLGVNGGVGFAYEYGGTTIDRMTVEERMTICNMSIEGGARVGYVNPDETTIEYLRGRPRECGCCDKQQCGNEERLHRVGAPKCTAGANYSIK